MKAPALAYLHVWEDKLCAQLGKEPRRDRPQLTSPKPALAQVRAAMTSG